MKRRDLIKNLSILPVSGVVLGSAVTLEPLTSAPKKAKTGERNLFKELGIRTFINAAGTYTAMSGCLMQPEVMEAIMSTSHDFAMIDEVQDKVGEKIAALCHAEAAMVTAGCWSALVLGSAAILTGMDPKKVEQLPVLTGMKSEVIVQQAHNHGYVHALTNTGVSVVEVETVADVERLASEKTAFMWFLNYAAPDGKISREEWVALAKKLNLPTMIDMAADATPVENLWKYNEMGFDLVCVSGGKGLRGPQSAGILMGRKDLIAAARLNGPPRGGNIGRGMKVNKEEILGMYVALEKFINMDHSKQWKIWEDRVAIMANSVKKVPGVTAEIIIPPVSNRTPTLIISWDINKVKITKEDFMGKLRKGNPSIEVMPAKDNGITITSWNLQDGEDKIVAKRLFEEFTSASA